MGNLRPGLYACACTLLCSVGLQAQSLDAGGSLGLLKTGMVHSNIPVAQLKALGMSPSLQASGGLFLTAHLSPHFALQPEFLYVPKGGEWQALGMTIKTRLTYVEIPILARVTFPLQRTRVTPSVFAGPAIAFRTGCEVTGEIAGLLSAAMTCENATGGLVSFKNTDAGVLFGAGVDVPVGRMRGFVEGRADFGLVNVAQGATGGELKNRTFGGVAGLAIPLGMPRVAASRTR